MTCRHSAGDPNCSSNRPQVVYRDNPNTPKPDEYEIERVERVGPHLVMEVQYPSCKKCAYEGNKVMVFLHVPEAQVLRWRRIDPHFRDPGPGFSPKEAPSPAARFPASADGWQDALDYARGKDG